MSFKKEREKLIGSFHGNCDMMTRHYLLQLSCMYITLCAVLAVREIFFQFNDGFNNLSV